MYARVVGVTIDRNPRERLLAAARGQRYVENQTEHSHLRPVAISELLPSGQRPWIAKIDKLWLGQHFKETIDVWLVRS
jgi:hypothetical protein